MSSLFSKDLVSDVIWKVSVSWAVPFHGTAWHVRAVAVNDKFRWAAFCICEVTITSATSRLFFGVLWEADDCGFVAIIVKLWNLLLVFELHVGIKSVFTQFQILRVFLEQLYFVLYSTPFCLFPFVTILVVSPLGLSNYLYENIFLSISCKLIYLRFVWYKRKPVFLRYNTCFLVLGEQNRFLPCSCSRPSWGQHVGASVTIRIHINSQIPVLLHSCAFMAGVT